MTLENDSLNNGVQHLSLNGNGMSTRNGNRMQGETIVRNGASEGSNVRSVVEKPFQNGHVIPNGKENFEPKPRTDEYDVDFSYVALTWYSGAILMVPSDTREFSVKRWEDLTSLALSRLSTQGSTLTEPFEHSVDFSRQGSCCRVLVLARCWE